MSIELGRMLILSGLAAPEDVRAALFHSLVRGQSLLRALVDRGAIVERVLEEELARRHGPPLHHVVPLRDVMVRLPPNLCRRLLVLPVRLDRRERVVEVAAADPLDPHVETELAFHLGARVRVLRASMAALEEALRRVELGEDPEPSAPRERLPTPPFPHGAPTTQPPPPSDVEVPIPLVRRAGLPLVDAGPEAPPPAPAPLDPPAARFSDAPEAQPRVSFPSHPPPATAAGDPFPSLGDAAPHLAALREAATRDDVIRQAMRALRTCARRVGVFVVLARKNVYQGWSCTVEMGDPEVFRRLEVAQDTPSVLATAAATGMYLGPIPDTPAHAGLRACLGASSHEVAVAPVRVSGRPVLLFLLDELVETMPGTRRASEIAAAAGEALTRILASRKG